MQENRTGATSMSEGTVGCSMQGRDTSRGGATGLLAD